MKNKIMKYVSALLLVWYCLSIIGFDVHSCTRTGKMFFASAYSGLSCGDIHPEQGCHAHGGCCCHSHEAAPHQHSSASTEDCETFSESECCVNDIHVLVVTGTASSDSHRYVSEWHWTYCPCVLSDFSAVERPFMVASAESFPKLPDSGLAAPDSQALLNIWRI